MAVYLVAYINPFDEYNPLIVGCFSSIEKANRALEAHWLMVQPNVKLEYYRIKEIYLDEFQGRII